MKPTNVFALMAMLFIALNPLSAQNFLAPSFTYSHDKIAYLTMDDGTQHEVYIKKIKREKGLIEEMKVEDANGKKVKIKPEEIKIMYLPQSGWDKMTKGMDFSPMPSSGTTKPLTPTKLPMATCILKRPKCR